MSESSAVSGSVAAFFERLGGLSAGELTVLRRARGRPLGADVAVFDLFNNLWRPLRKRTPAPRWACYLVASLYPWHRLHGGSGSLADAWRRMRAKRPRSEQEQIDRRFAELAAATGQALDTRMGQAIAILNAAEVPVDWQRLLGDLSRWYEPGAPVQNAWLDGYFGNA